MSCSQIWNIIGLLLGMVGVITLFVFGMPFRIRRGGMSFLALNEVDQADLKQERQFDVLGWIGFVFVIAGTICRIVATLA
jgi:hypothetical protein